MEKPELERALRESDERYRLVTENIGDAVFLVDRDDRLQFANSRCAALMGYDAGEFIGRSITTLFTPEAWARVAVRREAITAGRDVSPLFEVELVRKDTTRVWTEATISPIVKDGRVVGRLGVVRDITQRKAAEQALRASEERFRAIFEQAAVGLGITALDGRWLRVNQRLCDMVGYTMDEMLALRFQEMTHPDDIEVNLSIRDAMLTGAAASFSIEKRYLHKNGSVVRVEVTASPVRDPSGQVEFSVVIVQDITARAEAVAGRRETEEALRESEERTRLIVDHALDAVVTIDGAGRILTWNPRAEVLFGWSVRDAAGRLLSDLIVPPAYREAHARGLEHFRATGDGPMLGRRIELSAMRRDGSEFPVELAITPMQLKGSTVFSAFLRDITERKRSEIALRESEERFRATFEQAAVGITVTADDGRLLRVNQRFCDIVGYSIEELLTRRFQDVTHPDDVETNETRRRPMMAGEATTYSMEKRYVRKDGSIVWVHVTASQARDASGPAGYSIGIVEDVTQRKQLEQELLHAQRMEGIGQLAGGIAHDFNNLLTVISGRGQMLLDELRSEDPMRRDLELIQKTAERAATLTRQLLAFSRKQVLQPKVLSLNELVTASVSLLERLIGEHIELRFLPAADTGRVRVDPGQFEQVIINLAVNARDAMPEGGRLTLETANVELDAAEAARHFDVTPGPYVMLAISDTGMGMAPEVQARAFEPFFTTKERGKGTGLGLATVYGIVKQSGGHVRIDHSELGVGTTVAIFLPRTGEAPDAVATASKSVLPIGTETLLLVEDETEVRTLVREILERLGYTVFAAPTPRDALTIAERHPGLVDLLLTDVVMPQMNGRALAEAIAADRPEMKVLFMSGYTDDAIAQHGVLEPGTHFIGKPFTQQALAAKIREVLDRSE